MEVPPSNVSRRAIIGLRSLRIQRFQFEPYISYAVLD